MRWKIVKAAGLLSAFAMLLRLVQDYLHAYINAYPFYFSESILHKGFWFIFFPVSIVQAYAVKSISNIFSGRLQYGMLALLILTATLFHLAAFAFIVSAGSFIFLDHTYSFVRTLAYSFSEDTYLCLLIYSISAVAFSRMEAQVLTVQQKKQCLSSIMVGSGTKKIPVRTNDILYISSSSPYVALHTAERKFLHSETLKALGEQLDAEQFIRVHKSVIINIKEVESYQSRLNGDYDITLSNGEVVRMSRNFASDFKNHFG